MERRQKYAGDAHVPPGLIRMSVGIEHVDDIWADLAPGAVRLTGGQARRASSTSPRPRRCALSAAAQSAGTRDLDPLVRVGAATMPSHQSSTAAEHSDRVALGERGRAVGRHREHHPAAGRAWSPDDVGADQHLAGSDLAGGDRTGS